MTREEVKARLDAKVASLTKEKEEKEAIIRGKVQASRVAAEELREHLLVLKDYETTKGTTHVWVGGIDKALEVQEGWAIPVAIKAYDGDIESPLIGFWVSVGNGGTRIHQAGEFGTFITLDQALERAALEVEKNLVAP